MSATIHIYATRYIRSRLLRVALVLVLSLGAGQATHAAASAAVITLVKAIVASSADWGLDKAGEAWMPEHWADFKALVLSPLIKAFPALASDENQQIESKKQAVREALQALDSDEDLRYAIFKRLEKLEYGQEDIWNKVHVLSQWLADHESRISRLESMLGVSGSVQGAPLASARAEGLATIVEYKSIVRKILQAARHEFQDIRGEAFVSDGNKFRSILTLPGAEYCSVNKPASKFVGVWSLNCTIIRPTEGFIVTGIKMTKKEAQKYPPAPSWLKDEYKKRQPGQVYFAPPGTMIPTLEEALLAFLDTITKIREALPPHWVEQLPEHWESLREPRNWNGYKYRIKKNAIYYYKRKRGREPPPDWDSYNWVGEYKAESSDGRRVSVRLSSHGPSEFVKTPRDFFLSVAFIASKSDRD